MVGTDSERDLDHVGLSSDEDEFGVDFMESDFSMNESDYPLRNESLLQKLLYSGETALTGLTSKQLRQKPDELQKEICSTSVRPGEDGSCPPLPSPPGTDGGLPVDTTGQPPIPSTHPTGDPTSKPSQTPSTTSETLEGSRATSTTTTNDWSSASSLFGLQDRTLESAIVQAVGMERLTRLGRVTSARVVVETLQLDPSALDTIHSLQRKKKGRTTDSQLLRSAVPASGRLEYQYSCFRIHI